MKFASGALTLEKVLFAQSLLTVLFIPDQCCQLLKTENWKKNQKGLFWLFFYKINHFWLFSNQIGYFQSLRVGNTVPDLVKESIIVGDLFAFANGASGPNDA